MIDFRMMTFRLRFLLFGFLILGFLVILRLSFWQIIKAEELKNLARSQHQTSVTVPAHRGSILAKDGFPLVISVEAYLAWASIPDLEENPKDMAQKLAPILAREPIDEEVTKEEIVKEEEKRLLGLLTKEGAKWVALKNRVPREKKEKVENMNLAGIGFYLEEDRSYPEASMSAHLLGFVGKDTAGQDKGYFGLEGYYDLTLVGAPGELLRERDALGLPILIGLSSRVGALDGLDLNTHIDRTIQFFVERELAEGLEKYGAKSGTVIVMEPKSGAVLALASLPSYDPKNFKHYPKESFVNPAVGESFEPGSVFKIVVMASALDAKAVKPEDKCEVCSGPRRIAEYTIATWNKEYHPDATPKEIIQYSDNVGMIWTAEKLGIDKFVDYIKRFGFGRGTGIDLQDEASPSIRKDKDWKFIDLAVSAFGQGIAVTPIQMVRAVAAIANGGVLPTPQVVDKITGESWEQDIKPVSEGRVISQETSRQVTEMMVNAVESGEAKWAKPKGFKIAGKTGTAQIPVAGHYDEEKTIASFVGFAPADKPRFVMLVTLQEPTSSPWGSETAAPLWFSIAKDIFPYLGIQPE